MRKMILATIASVLVMNYAMSAEKSGGFPEEMRSIAVESQTFERMRFDIENKPVLINHTIETIAFYQDEKEILLLDENLTEFNVKKVQTAKESNAKVNFDKENVSIEVK